MNCFSTTKCPVLRRLPELFDLIVLAADTLGVPNPSARNLSDARFYFRSAAKVCKTELLRTSGLGSSFRLQDVIDCVALAEAAIKPNNFEQRELAFARLRLNTAKWLVCHEMSLRSTGRVTKFC